MTDYIENEATNSEPEETREPDCYLTTLNLTGRSLACEETIYLGFFRTKELAIRAGKFACDNFAAFYPNRKCSIEVNHEEFVEADIAQFLSGLADQPDHKHTLGHNSSPTTVYSDWFYEYMGSHSAANYVRPNTGKQD